MKFLDFSMWHYLIFPFGCFISRYISLLNYHAVNNLVHRTFTSHPEGDVEFDKEHLYYFTENLLKHVAITHSAALINDVQERSRSITHHPVICSLTSITAWPIGLHQLDILYVPQGGDIQLKAIA